MVDYNGCHLYAGKILNHVNNNKLVYEKTCSWKNIYSYMWKIFMVDQAYTKLDEKCNTYVSSWKFGEKYVL